MDTGGGAFGGIEASQEAEYVPIRTLGKGAYGEAVLYRKVAVSTFKSIISYAYDGLM